MESQLSRTPVTPLLLALFFAAAAVLSLAAAVTLLVPDTPLEPIWRYKQLEHARLAWFGWRAGLGFFGLSLILAVLSVGAFGRRRGAWIPALAIFLIEAAGDGVRIGTGAWRDGAFGLAISLIVITWLLRPSVRSLFDR